MGNIKVLNKEVSSKIAAGEVVERPVSIVKELIENSLDARSKNIIVEIEGGGKKCIKVIDDGDGIQRDDIKLAFERHATSKISKEEDIFNIKTLGFRGEALASIAAVSQVTIISKTYDEEVGTKCVVVGGVYKGTDDAPTNKGCIVEVKNLFFNTPARTKFLKSDTIEAGYIADLISKYALCNPNVSFRFLKEGKESFYTSGSGECEEAIAKVFGIEVAKNIIKFEKPFADGFVSGFVALPQFNKGNRSAQIFFVNKRLIEDKGLSFSLERAFKTLIPINRFPIGVLFVTIDSSKVDVNVHPSKTQIKFHREGHLYNAVTEVVKAELKEKILIPKEDIPVRYHEGKYDKEQFFQTQNILPDEYFSKYHETIIQDTDIIKETNTDKIKTEKSYGNHHHVSKLSFISEQKGLSFDKIIGQLFETYIIAQNNKSFYLIDQHAAHEKILYEKQIAKQESDSIATQQLITPYTMQLSIKEVMFLEEHISLFKDIGFEVSVFGRDTILIREVPYISGKAVSPILLRKILDDVIDGGKGDDPLAKEKMAASVACHAAIKAGETLSMSEMRELLSQLEELKAPYTCPHGRPTIICISLYEIEKKFKRVQ